MNAQLRLITFGPLIRNLQVLGKPLPKPVGATAGNNVLQVYTFGSGSRTVLAWSGMHGNEHTSIRGTMEALRTITDLWLTSRDLRLLYIPVLNVDGLALYTRENAVGVDVNRDAQSLETPEAQFLMQCIEEFHPDLCLNLHDQRTMYGVNNPVQPSVLSFLAAAADHARRVTRARIIAAHLINAFAHDSSLPIGRYDDGFNANCFGDALMMKGIPTILFEAGQAQGDYERVDTVDAFAKAIITVLDTFSNMSAPDDDAWDKYLTIPEQVNTVVDELHEENGLYYGVRYTEVAKGPNLKFLPGERFAIDGPHVGFHRDMR